MALHYQHHTTKCHNSHKHSQSPVTTILLKAECINAATHPNKAQCNKIGDSGAKAKMF